MLRKPGTDIEDSRVTWLALMAMDIATEPQKAKLIENYGKRGKIMNEISNLSFSYG